VRFQAQQDWRIGRFHSLRGYCVVAGASDLESGAYGAFCVFFSLAWV
jgi:hypothetical protein